MTDEQLQRIHDIEYSCDSREELAERIVGLEDELAKWERLTAGIELPEYPITQFQPKDLERKNDKLREFVKKLYGGYMGGHYIISCNGCEYAYEDDGGYTPLDPDCCVFSFSDRYIGCWKRKRLEAEMRELGVEVD